MKVNKFTVLQEDDNSREFLDGIPAGRGVVMQGMRLLTWLHPLWAPLPVLPPLPNERLEIWL